MDLVRQLAGMLRPTKRMDEMPALDIAPFASPPRHNAPATVATVEHGVQGHSHRSTCHSLSLSYHLLPPHGFSSPLSPINVIIPRVVTRSIDVLLFTPMPPCPIYLVPSHLHSLPLILQLDLSHFRLQVGTISFVALDERFSFTHSLLTFYHKPLVFLAYLFTSYPPWPLSLHRDSVSTLLPLPAIIGFIDRPPHLRLLWQTQPSHSAILLTPTSP